MKRIMSLFVLTFGLITGMFAQNEDTKERQKDVIEFGVKQISRICPTFIWDGWKFKGIEYNKRDDVLTLIIQIRRWNADKAPTSIEEVDKNAKWIIESLMKGYNMVISDKEIAGDGDFMLYFSVGNLLQYVSNTDTKTNVMILKPDKESIVYPDIPSIDSRKMNEYLGKK
jgi:hypothetical protein